MAVVHALQGHQDDLEDFIILYLLEVYVKTCLPQDELSTLLEAEQIAFLKLTIVLLLLLDGVVGQVDKWLIN